MPGVGGVGGVSGAAGLQQLAEMYRRQVSGAGAAPDAGAAAGTAASAGPSAAGRSADFAGAVSTSLDGLQRLDRTAAGMATQAATGTLGDVQDYVIASTQAQLATQLTTTVRNKALESFNDIMRMPL